MVNFKEVRNKIGQFNKSSLMIFANAIRLPLFLMLGCGQFKFKEDRVIWPEVKATAHDHQVGNVVPREDQVVVLMAGRPYIIDQDQGSKEDWVDEGKQDSKGHIHDHEHCTL